ncbi:hypothetical protein DPMN_068327 [Dreissena polymorpha]|uniref:Uncharacterized protein n=1 Tax=Dreissena polymorpha TaxID=45954 RepID=A0A9D3YXG1_DREPO|nr:hypothetical protein DPMN_068327 [Dreissena polymorpha]
MCAWNSHYCWPGTCDNGLTKDCNCATGFGKRVRVDNSSINAGETTCQPETLPDIMTCNTVAVGPKGEKKQAISSTSSTACSYLTDMYGNFMPTTMEFDMSSEFTIDVSLFNNIRPGFIKEETFGISDTTIHVKIQTIQGKYRHIL